MIDHMNSDPHSKVSVFSLGKQAGQNKGLFAQEGRLWGVFHLKTVGSGAISTSIWSHLTFWTRCLVTLLLIYWSCQSLKINKDWLTPSYYRRTKMTHVTVMLLLLIEFWFLENMNMNQNLLLSKSQLKYQPKQNKHKHWKQGSIFKK